jgi:hypothetical protein
MHVSHTEPVEVCGEAIDPDPDLSGEGRLCSEENTLQPLVRINNEYK